MTTQSARKSRTLLKSISGLVLAASSVLGLHATPTLLVSNLGDSNGGDYPVAYYSEYEEEGEGSNYAEAESFTTGSGAYLLSAVTLQIGGGSGSGFAVALYGNSSGQPGPLIEVLSGSSAPTSGGPVAYAPGAPVVLQPNTTYWVVASVPSVNGDNFSWICTASSTVTGASGWTLGNNAYQQDDGGDFNAGPDVLQLSVSGTAASAPSLSTEPAALTAVTAGGSFSLSVAATGSPLPTYQWFLNGTPLADGTQADGSATSGSATTTLEVSGFTGAEAGTYTLSATNVVSSVTSTAAVVSLPQAPAITTQPTAQAVLLGGSLTLTVAASGNPLPSYQWSFNGSAIGGATSSTYTVGAVGTSNQGLYAATAVNAAGTASSASVQVNIAVTAVSNLNDANGGDYPVAYYSEFEEEGEGSNYAEAEYFTTGAVPTQLSGITLFLGGGNGSGFSVALCSDNAGQPGSVVQRLSGPTAPTASGQQTYSPTSPLTLEANTKYWFVASVPSVNGDQFNWICTASSSVTGLTGWTMAPNAFQQDDGGSFNSGPDVLEFSVSVLDTTAPSFQQQPAAFTALRTGGSFSLSAAASGLPSPTFQWSLNGTPLTDGPQSDGSVISGSATGTLAVSGFTSAEAGSYAVVASNSVSAVTSAAALVSVGAAPAITTQPAAQAVVAGGTLTLTVVATGVPAPALQWYDDGTALSGATSSTYTATAVGNANRGTYSVDASNAFGAVASASVQVTVGVAPVIATQPASKTGLVGYPVSLVVYASGSPAPTYQWALNGTPLAGATSSVYSVGSVSLGNAGVYTATAANGYGTATSGGATLTVDTVPTITTQPSSQAVAAGSTLTLTVAATAIPAPTTYQWLFDGVNIGGATSSVLVLPAMAPSNQGLYSVTVGNGVAAAGSSFASVTVGVAPTFTTEPVSETGLAGYAVSFSSWASASPFPAYQWSLNGTPIGGATSSSYSISSVTSGQAGNYTVTATNIVGTQTSSTAVLTVDALPSITGQPASQVDDTGATVTLTVAANGTPGPSAYQWYLNGTALPGATSSTYAVVYAGQPASGLYQATVGNGLATVASAVADVHVLAPVLTRAEGPVAAGAQGVIASTFTLTGSVRTILILGVGPGLDVAGSLANPTLSLYYGPGVSSPLLYTNTNWTTGGNQATIASMADGHCGVLLSGTSADSALLAFLPAGTYTAVLSGADGSTGLGSLQVYDLSNASPVNADVHTQSPVTGSQGCSQTFLVTGNPTSVLVTGLGSGLSGKSIGEPLAVPVLSVEDWTGAVVGSNEGYTTAGNSAAIAAAESTLSGYTMGGTDSGVLLASLPEGVYTATVTSGDASSGVTEIDALQQ